MEHPVSLFHVKNEEISMITEFDTIAAIATPVANSGIGIIRISGSDTFSIIKRIFRPHKKDCDMSDPESYRMYYGNVLDGEDIIDECIVLIMKNPNSYTREDVAEIDCHGGVSILYRVYNLVLRSGARAAEPGEFTKRAFLNGRIDLAQAEAVMDLIESRNESARINSLKQLKGGLSEKIRSLREEILYEMAFIESALDDPEHYDLSGYSEKILEKNTQWRSMIKKMIDSFEDGRFMKEGIRTCIVGKPNAGKSSFLNALLGEERAIVTEVEGTTRDTLQESVTIDGITLIIIDTAGIRDTEDKVEKIGVERTYQEIDQADLVLFVVDMSRDISEEDKDIIRSITGKNVMIILNKNDMIDAKDFDRSFLCDILGEGIPMIEVSSRYHTGFDRFTEQIQSMMFHGKLDVNEEFYVTNARHRQLLLEAFGSLGLVEDSIHQEMPEDFLTIDLMNAFEKLGLIIGEALEDDLANEIFSRFCMGK